MATWGTQVHLFYPLLFLTICLFLIISGCVIKSIFNGSYFKAIFFKSSDNAKDVTVDTTSKMQSMHDKVIPIRYDVSKELEFHSLERGLRQLTRNVHELNDKVDILLDRVITIEQQQK